jgi:hypothetical protein
MKSVTKRERPLVFSFETRVDLQGTDDKYMKENYV